jgi:hypothetical protein
MIRFRSPLFLLPLFGLIAFSSHASAAERNENCIGRVTILENMLDAEKMKYANDKCGLLKAAATTRAAMIDEIGKDSDSCGFDAGTVAAMKSQYEKYTSMQASVCH